MQRTMLKTCLLVCACFRYIQEVLLLSGNMAAWGWIISPGKVLPTVAHLAMLGALLQLMLGSVTFGGTSYKCRLLHEV